MSEEHPNISGSINLSKIDEKYIIHGKNGDYVNVFFHYSQRTFPDGKTVDYTIFQEVPKEVRESGVKGAILGNAKRIVRRVEQNAPQATTQRPAAKPAQSTTGDDSIPF